MNKTSILIVEDEAIVAEDIRHTVERLGYSVTAVVSSGKEALINAQEQNPALVLMDIVLQGDMNGIATAEAIRRQYQIPVVFLTAYADTNTLEQVKATEPFGYILKPFEDRELLTAIEIALYKSYTEKRIKHLNAVLRAIRNVNQLIFKERDREKLIQKTCDLLVETRGYQQAWILLLDESGQMVKGVHANYSLESCPLSETLCHKTIPACQALLKNEDFIAVSDILATLPDCFLSLAHEGQGAFITRLETDKTCYGLAGVVLPGALNAHEEQILFREVAEDIAYALRGIDLAEQTQLAEADRQQLEARFRAMFNSTPNVAIQGFDRERRLLYCNKAAEDMFGLTEGEALGKTLEQFFFSLDLGKEFENIFTEVDLTGKSFGPREINFLHKSDCMGTGYTTFFSIPTNPDSKEFISMTVDITARKQAEETKAHLESQLFHIQKLEALGTLAGGIAHDFNNILSALLGYNELSLMILEGDPDKEQLKKNLLAVQQAGTRARDLVKKILTFSQKTEQQSKPVKVSFIVKEALELLRASLPTTIDIRTSFESTNDVVWADQVQIHQVVMNLCTNAYQAMQKRGGVLSVSLESIQIKATQNQSTARLQEGTYLLLTVKDTGTGMAPWVQARIFEPYFTTKGTGEGGTGLGLSVVHGIVTSLGGTLEVTSIPEKGTTFQVYLPQMEHPELMVVAEKNQVAIPHGQGQILFIDDEEPIAALVKQFLESLGYRVIASTSSVEALKIFLDNPATIDLVITDLTMPKLTGLELARKLLQQRSGLPIILCSGYNNRAVLAEGKSIGIMDYLTKPVNLGSLAATVSRALCGPKPHEAVERPQQLH
jgi:PAS domain S-box-containing protein